MLGKSLCFSFKSTTSSICSVTLIYGLFVGIALFIQSCAGVEELDNENNLHFSQEHRPAVPCGSKICKPKASICSANGLGLTIYDAPVCITPDTNPRCVWGEQEQKCSHGCQGGQCLAASCKNDFGEPHFDLCGNGLDEDCSGSSRKCSPPLFSTYHYEDVNIYPGMILDKDRVDHWLLALKVAPQIVGGARLINNTMDRIKVEKPGHITKWIEPRGELKIEGIRTDHPQETFQVTLSNNKAESATLEFGYFETNERPARFVGKFYSEQTQWLPVTIKIWGIPSITSPNPGYPYYNSGLDNCFGTEECHLGIKAEVEIDGKVQLKVPPINTYVAHLRWLHPTYSVPSPGSLRVLMGDSFSFEGEPNHLTGKFKNGSLSGDLFLRLE